MPGCTPAAAAADARVLPRAAKTVVGCTPAIGDDDGGSGGGGGGSKSILPCGAVGLYAVMEAPFSVGARCRTAVPFEDERGEL